ncbi:FAD-dependent oxidoreductase [Rhodococcus sp. NPDC003348]
MTHVILGHCCKDASCVRVCPQNCIHPIPGEPAFETAETLFIDPGSCIDCTACVEACPASAIKPEWALTVVERPNAARNREFYARSSATTRTQRRRTTFDRPLGRPGDGITVAVVGSGPAAMYTVRELLRRSTSIRVTVYEQYDTIGGLLHRGVSRDHVGVREMIRLFDVPFGDDRVTVVANTEVGVDISVDELRARFDAVVLACGASQPRRPGSVAGHGVTVGTDDGIHQAIDILVAENCEESGFRPPTPLGATCLVVGAGNVAFDVVRWAANSRARGPADGRINQVVVLSRSAPDRASFTPSAFHELRDLAETELLIDSAGSAPSPDADDALVRDLARLPVTDLSSTDLDAATASADGTGVRLRVVLSFGQEVAGVRRDAAGGVTVTTETGRTFRADSAICATGFTTKPIDGIPLDARGAVPNDRGRVISHETGAPLHNLYVVGWAKRGARGGVGDNRLCASETVDQLARAVAARV